MIFLKLGIIQGQTKHFLSNNTENQTNSENKTKFVLYTVYVHGIFSKMHLFA